VNSYDLELRTDIRPSYRARITMAAADNGVHRDTLADACRRYLLADGVDDAIEFMADDAGIFRERVVAVIDVYIGTTDPSKSNFHPYFMGARNWNRT